MIGALMAILSKLVNYANFANADATVSSRLSTFVNSMQYGTTTITDTATSATATVTSVSTSKAVLAFLGQKVPSTANPNTQDAAARKPGTAVLTNATTVTVAIGTAWGAGNGTSIIYWSLCEYK